MLKRISPGRPVESKRRKAPNKGHLAGVSVDIPVSSLLTRSFHCGDAGGVSHSSERLKYGDRIVLLPHWERPGFPRPIFSPAITD